MKIKVASISTFARPASITMREWEALGRFAVRVEEEVGRHSDDSRIGRMLDLPFKRYLTDEIERRLVQEDLNPKDWFVHLEPELLPQEPVPYTIKTWVLHMRLKDATSAAKRLAANTVASVESTFKPTLAEQFEKKEG